MIQIIVGSITLSLLHALLPNHWLPVLALGRQQGWSQTETEGFAVASGLAHALSTIIIGVLVGLVGMKLADMVAYFTQWIAPAILIGMGLFFIWRHHKHHHFHLHTNELNPKLSKRRLLILLVVAMFFSPCLEIEAFFLSAGSIGWSLIAIIAILYLVITVLGMWVWVRWAYPRLLHLNWHRLEHNAGIITGLILIVTGLITWLHG